MSERGALLKATWNSEYDGPARRAWAAWVQTRRRALTPEVRAARDAAIIAAREQVPPQTWRAIGAQHDISGERARHVYHMAKRRQA